MRSREVIGVIELSVVPPEDTLAPLVKVKQLWQKRGTGPVPY